MKVIKRDGTAQTFDKGKIERAILLAAERSAEEDVGLHANLAANIVERNLPEGDTTVDRIHQEVITALGLLGFSKTQECYKSYVNYKRNFVQILDDLHKQAQSVINYGDKENANFESSLVSTQQSLIRGHLTKELYKINYLSTKEQEAIKDGYIYIHDMRDLLFNTINCCLFDIGEVLNGGFEMANLKYKEPNSVLAALQLVGDVTLAASAQQYGGFTLAELDKVLVPYVKKSLHNYKEQARKYNITDEGYPLDCVKRELSQGFQSLEMKLNSIPSSRGDFSFSTVTFGNLDTDNLCDKTLQYYVCEAILNQRINGENVVFPKLVMLYSEEQNEKCSLQQRLFDLSITCSCKNLYPDYLAIDTVGEVSDLYRETGKVVSPMG